MKLNIYGNMPIITPRDPQVPMEAANKNYVDNTMAQHANNMSLHLTVDQNTFLDSLTINATEANRLSGITGNVQTQLDNKVALSGSVMTGLLTLSGNPTGNLHAATKQYVDSQDALNVSKAGDTMTGDLTLKGDPTSALHAAPKQYVDATVNSHADDATKHLTAAQNTFLDAVTVSSTEVNQLAGVTSAVQTQLDSKLPKSGGTMTGDLVLNADPTANLQAATKNYVDTKDALKVNKAGDTMTGALVLPGNPTASLEAAPKQYVDSTVSTHASDTALHLTASQNTFLDAVTVSSTEVNRLAGVTSDVQTQLDSKLALAGGTMTGSLNLAADPTVSTEAATKNYVDTKDGLKVSKAGDTMTGALTLAGNPENALEAAPKQYVDSTVTSHADDATKHLTAAQNTFLDGVSVSSTEVNRLSGVTDNVQTQLDAKLNLAGGTMTGTLVLSGAPVNPSDAVTKTYADTQDALKVSKSGDTMTGALTLPGDPTTNLQAATKQYVDSTVTDHANDAAKHLTVAQNTFLDAVTVTATEVNQLSGVGSNVQSQLDDKFAKAGGLITGDVTLDTGKTIFVSKVPDAGTEVVNKAYVDSKLNGQDWKDPVTDVELVDIALDTPPASPVAKDVYIIGDAPTGAWAGKAGYATFHNGTEWVFLQGRAVAAGDRFGVAFTSATALTGTLVGQGKKIITIIDATPGAIQFTTDALSAAATTLVFDPQSSKFGVSYTLTDEGNWVPTNTSVNLTAGEALDLSGNILNVKHGDGLEVNADVLEVKLDTSTGVEFTAGGAVAVKRDGTTISASANGIKVSDAVISDIADKVSKTGTSAVTGSVTFDTNASLKTNFTATDDAHVVNKGYVDAADEALDGRVDTLETTVGTLNSDPTTKTYVDQQDALKVSKAGDTMTGALTLPGDPTADLQAAPKQYVDSTVSTHASDDARHLTTAQNTFLDAVTVSATEVNRLNGVTSNVQTQIDSKLALAGGTMTGALALAADPTENLQAATKQYVDTKDATKVSKAGDTMTGALTLPGNPTADLEAAPKQYVDSSVSAHANDDARHMTVEQNAFLDAVTVDATEINQLDGVTDNVQMQIDSKLSKSGGTMTGAITLPADPINALEAATKQYVDTQDGTKVAKAGDTMTGFLTLNADPTSALHATTKQYVDSNLNSHVEDTAVHMTAAQNTFLDALTVTSTEVNRLSGVSSNVQTQLNAKLNLAGGTMTGVLTLDADPTDNLQAATKQYVDNQDATKVNKAGDTMTGALTLPGDPTSALQAATKGYVDTNLSSHATDNTIHITAAQNTFLDGISVTAEEVNHLEGVDENVQLQIDSKLNLTGGTLTGFLTLHANPTANLEAAPKQYVDSQDALKVSKAGDTMTGALVLHADPTAAFEAATKQYVDTKDGDQKTYIDNQDATKVNKAGDTMTGFLTLSAAPTADLHASTKKYVDDKDATQKTYIDEQDSALDGRIDTLESTVSTLNSDPVTKNYVDSLAATKLNIAGGTMTGYITLHADPQQNMHPATKQYVDAVAQGLSTKPSVRFATTANISAVYNNGTSGVNATLTGSANGALVVDGKTVMIGNRILVKDQTNKAENGDYTVQQVGDASTPFILKRVSTIDESHEVPGSYFYVYDGDTLKGTGWVFTVANPVTFSIGTDDINVNQFSGQGSLIAGAGLTMDGNTLNINSANSGRIVVNADSIDLATTGVTPNSYTKVTVDGYGRVTAGSNPNTLAGFGITDGQQLNANLTSLSAVVSTGIVVRDNTNTMVTKAVTHSGVGITVTNGDGAAAGNITIVSNATSAATADAIVSRDASGNFAANIITASLNGNASTATTLATSRDFSLTGDITAAVVSFNGSANVALNTSLTTTGVEAGTYTQVTVDTKGRVSAGSNPTTIAGLGVQDVYTKAEVDAIVTAMEKKFNELYLYLLSRS